VIGTRVKDVGRLSFTMECRIERDGELVAEGETILVCMDYQKRKPRRIDMEFREKVEAFELR